MIKVVNVLTGEVYELEDDTDEKISTAWQLLSQTIKACERAKDKLKPKIEELVDSKGLHEVGDHQFRVMSIQRYNYNKATLREVLNPDDFDVLTVPDKPRIDTFIKEHLDVLGDKSTKLRDSMIPVGNPYQTIKLEKLK